MTYRLSGVRTYAGTPVPRIGEKESGKLLLSVDFETGKINWDKEWEKTMKPKADITKEQFFEAVRTSKTNKEAMGKLGIAGTCFYKYRNLYADEVDKPAPDMDVRLDPVDADYQNEDPTDYAVVGQKISIELNPEPPKDNNISVLEAVNLLEDMREESDSVSAIFECMKNQPWHPNIRSILLSHKLGVDRQIKRIEEVLESITVAI